MATQGKKTGHPHKAIPGGPPVGRPTKYTDKTAQLAHDFALLGATDVFIAEKLGIDTQTFYNWMESKEEFFEAVNSGKEYADAQVAKSLYKRALGYSHPEDDIKVVAGQITITQTTKHYPPDTAAATLWLKNRQKAVWRDKVETEITGADGGAVKLDVSIGPDEAYLRMIGK
jgi:hypothetical protein